MRPRCRLHRTWSTEKAHQVTNALLTLLVPQVLLEQQQLAPLALLELQALLPLLAL